MRSLRPADLETLLADLPLVARTYFFEEITSTSDWAKDLVRRAGPGADLHGTLVIANYQTAGRGRFARAWHSPPGRSLLFSLILAPKAGSPASAAEPDSPRPGAFDRLVAVAAPVAVCEAIAEQAGLAPRIKYPNDVLLDGRKVAGILIERTAAAGGGAGVCVLGIGVNVNQSREELDPSVRVTPVSVALAAGRPIEPAPLLAALLRRLEANLASPERAAARMAALCDTVGRMVTVRTGGAVLQGTALAWQPLDGSLLIRLDSGVEVSVLSGDIEQLDWNRAPEVPSAAPDSMAREASA